MKKVLISCLILVFMAGDVWAAPNRVNEAADRQTLLNNISDAWATRGKSESDKREIIRKRKIERRHKRLQKIKEQQIKQTLDRYKKPQP